MRNTSIAKGVDFNRKKKLLIKFSFFFFLSNIWRVGDELPKHNSGAPTSLTLPNANIPKENVRFKHGWID